MFLRFSYGFPITYPDGYDMIWDDLIWYDMIWDVVREVFWDALRPWRMMIFDAWRFPMKVWYPKSISRGFPIMNHPSWGTSIFCKPPYMFTVDNICEYTNIYVSGSVCGRCSHWTSGPWWPLKRKKTSGCCVSPRGSQVDMRATPY